MMFLCRTSSRSTHFLSYQSAQYSHPKDGGAGKIKGLHKLAIQAIDRLQPYKAGNRPLRLIHKLDIINKHRLLITAGQANMAVSVPGGRKAVPATSEVELLNQGDKVFTVDRLELNDQVSFFIDVALNEPDLIEPTPLYSVLVNSVVEVRRVIRELGRLVS